jgi:hypothetical protein
VRDLAQRKAFIPSPETFEKLVNPITESIE